MDQRTDDIRQSIESTRGALDEKLDALETRARETFDIRHHVSEQPWMALGAAVAAGFVLGSVGGEAEQRWQGQPTVTTDYNQHAYTQASSQGGPKSNSFMSEFDDEIALLKGAAISALTTFLHDSIRTYIPTLGQHLESASRGADRTPSTAPNTSYDNGAGRAGFDSPPGVRGQSNQRSNPEVGGSAPYYPPGSSGGERHDETTTYPATSDHEHAVGEGRGYWREA